MSDATPPPLQLLRIEQVAERTALGKSTIYERIRQGKFPEPYRLGVKCTRWLTGDIDAWILAQIS